MCTFLFRPSVDLMKICNLHSTTRSSYKKEVYKKLLVAQPKNVRKFICTVLNAKKVHKKLFKRLAVKCTFFSPYRGLSG